MILFQSMNATADDRDLESHADRALDQGWPGPRLHVPTG